MSKYLFFKIKSVAYGSYLYFADSLGKALEDMGNTVHYFDSSKEPLENLERLIGQKYDALFDFNSALPRLAMDDESYFLDHVDAPFYNILLDHPLYHHDSLKHKLSNMHVLCLDEKHVAYVKTYYPHIKSVDLFAMTGSHATGNSALKSDILFTGSYTSSKEVLEALNKLPAFMRKITTDAIDYMLPDPFLSVEEALSTLSASYDDSESSMIQEHFPLHVQSCFLADTYVRSLRRENVLKAIISANLPLTLCGNGWEKLVGSDSNNVKILKDTAFSDTFSLMKAAKITLNIMPVFTAGSHDRVYSAMLNNSLCLTDESSLLRQQFTDKNDILFFDISAPSQAADIASDLLADESDTASKIRDNGHKKAMSDHTWAQRSAWLIKILHSND